jgi:hypothetical protein
MPKKPKAEPEVYNDDAIMHSALALLQLSLGEPGEGRAWKGLPFSVLDRLFEQGFIEDPRSAAKSVVVTDRGLNACGEAARELFQRPKRGRERPQTKRDILSLTAVIRHIEPKVTRTLEVPSTFNLGDLHHALQIAFAWEDRHLHAFHIDGQEYEAAAPEMRGKDEKRFLLKKLRTGTTFFYHYDFGDDWLVDVTVDDRKTAAEKQPYPHCVDGKNAAPPEDSGGPFGYIEKLQALATKRHPEHEEVKKWMPRRFDRCFFDRLAVNAALMRRF